MAKSKKLKEPDLEMRLPSSINILGTWVKIHYVRHIPAAKNEEYVHGLFEIDRNLITIAITTPEEMYKTLLHEIMHALLAYSGIGQLLNVKTEEAICSVAENYGKLFRLCDSKQIRFRKRAFHF